MKEAEYYRGEFIRQAKKDIEILLSLYSRWKSNPAKGAYLQDIMRISHSMKSGASFLHLDQIEMNAHSVESCVAEAIKQRKMNKEKIKQLQSGLQVLKEAVASLGEGAKSTEEDAGTEGEADVSLNRTYYLSLSSFDKKLLTEGWKNGERFFRVDCHLDAEEPMKYARAYLINSNMESCSTVIKTVPSLDNQEEDFSTLSLFLTTDLPESELQTALNIDRLSRVEISLLDWKEYISDNEVIPFSVKKSEDSLSGRFISIETERIEDLKNFAEALRVKLDMLHPGTMGLADLKKISSSFSRVLEEVTLVPVFSVFNSFPQYVTEIGAERGKLVRMEISGGDYAMDRTRLNSLATAFQHLLRNAVGHGVEMPQERMEAEKPKEGHIFLDISKKGRMFHIRLSDDGRGIDGELLCKQARDRGVKFDEEQRSDDLLELLAMPGFSTSDKVTSLSGRGVGLESALHIIRDILGGTVTLKSTPGTGTEFTLEIPDSRTLQRLLIFRKGKNYFALPSRNIDRSFPLNREALRVDRNSDRRFYHLYAEYLPLFWGNRPCEKGDSLPDKGYAILFRQSGKRGIHIADELIMEKEISEEDFKLKKQVKPYLYSAEIQGEPADFYYLSPTLLG